MLPDPTAMPDAIAGVDEAGRGPVIGPMVLALVGVAPQDLADLRTVGVRDSKRLTRTRRASLIEPILERARFWDVFFFLPAAMDRASLTALTVDVLVAWIDRYRPATLWVDALTTPAAIPALVRSIRRRLPDWTGRLRMEPAAERHPAVAAASVVAKVLRDEAVRWLRDRYGDFGWGYPSEARTRRFLEEWYRRYGRWPVWVRTKWQTCRQIEDAGYEMRDAGSGPATADAGP